MDSDFPPTDYDSLKGYAHWVTRHKQDNEIVSNRCKCNKLIKILISIIETLDKDAEDYELYHKIIDLKELEKSE